MYWEWEGVRVNRYPRYFDLSMCRIARMTRAPPAAAADADDLPAWALQLESINIIKKKRRGKGDLE